MIQLDAGKIQGTGELPIPLVSQCPLVAHRTPHHAGVFRGSCGKKQTGDDAGFDAGRFDPEIERAGLRGIIRQG
jgi:hypothetical protein